MLLSAIVLAATAIAQPTVFPEVTSWTMERATPISAAPAGALSLVRGARGLVLAWSGGPPPSRIYVARLDTTLRVIDGTVREMPKLFGDLSIADQPQLTVVSDAPVLQWRELFDDPTHNTVAVARLGANLDAAPPALATNIDAPTPIVFGPGGDDSVVVMGDDQIVTVDAAGSRFFDRPIGSIDAAAFGGGHVAYISHLTHLPNGCSGFFCPPITYDQQLLIDGRVVSTLSAKVTALLGPLSLATDGANSLVAWPEDGRIVAARVLADGRTDVAGARLFLGSDAVPRPPAIATDGTHWVVVWATQNHDIRAAALTMDGLSQELTIASDARDKESPAVTAIANGVFVVGYEVEVDATHRQLAGRYVTFVPPRPRPGGK